MHDPTVPPARLGYGRVITRRAALNAATVILTGVVASSLLPSRASALAEEDVASVKVINRSKWEIHHLFLSATDQDEWGPDQLENDVLSTGSSFTITKIPCDEYDVKVVDEDGDECIIEQVSLCGDQSYWAITDKDLLECEGFEKAASQTRCPTA
jgi:hypothetical protein